MHDAVQKKGSEGRSEYLLQWLDADSDALGSIADDGAFVGNEDEGFAARLYHLCLVVLQMCYRHEVGKGTSRSRLLGLKESLGKLYLWGESFGSGQLDKALEQSDELRNNSAATIDLSRGSFRPPEQAIELDALVKQAKDVIFEYQERGGDDSDEDQDTESESCLDRASSDLCEELGFYTTCLAEMRPSLEQNLIRAEKYSSQNHCPPAVSFSLSDPATTSTPSVDRKTPVAMTASGPKIGQKELYEAAGMIFNELKGLTADAAPFLGKVNRNEAPAYFESIKAPMDLGTVTEKLKSYQYKSKVDFINDLNLIWANCLKYNTSSEELRKKAIAMRERTEKLVPLISSIVIRNRAEVEAEERRGQSCDAPVNDENSEDEPIIAPRRDAVSSPKSKQPAKLFKFRSIADKPLSELLTSKNPASRKLVNNRGAFELPSIFTEVYEPGTRLAHKHACDRCIQRKTGCSPAYPKCLPCARSGSECTFTKRASLDRQTQSEKSTDNLKYARASMARGYPDEAYDDRINKAATYQTLTSKDQENLGLSLPQPEFNENDSLIQSPKRHGCPYCSTSFARHHDLKSHLLTHFHEKPFRCDNCEARFRRAHDLKRHTKLHADHADHSPRVCPQCTRYFASADALARHISGRECTEVGSFVGGPSGEGKIYEMRRGPSPRDGVNEVDIQPRERMPSSSLVQPGPIKQKGSLGEYISRRKGSQPTADMQAPSSPTMQQGSVKPPRSGSADGASGLSDFWVGTEWSVENDIILLRLRQEGLDWPAIVSKHFPNVTTNDIRAYYFQLLGFTEEQSVNGQSEVVQVSTGRCHSCNRAETPQWRRGPDGMRTLCNGCGLHYAKLTRKIELRETELNAPNDTRIYSDLNATNDTLPTYDSLYKITSEASKNVRGRTEEYEQPQPSLTRERHPIFGDSVFSEGQSVYHTNEDIEHLPSQRERKETGMHSLSSDAAVKNYVDKDERLFICGKAGCDSTLGFTHVGGLLRHLRGAHGQEVCYFCPHQNCARSTGRGFFEEENMYEHLRRVHNSQEEALERWRQYPEPQDTPFVWGK